METKIDILYIVGRGSAWFNNELRYSLRSIAKYGVGINRVFICGYVPKFVNRETVVCLPLQDDTDCKHVNICSAITHACKHTDIGGESGHFLYSSDDHFYTQPTDFANYPIYVKGRLPERVEPSDTHAAYHTTLANTHAVLSGNGYPTIMYCWHGNTHFNRQIWLSAEVQNLLLRGAEMPHGVEPTCIMGNVAIYCDVRWRSDVKLSHDMTMDEVAQVGIDRECISSVPDIAGSGLHDYLYKQFPRKCIYEV